MIGREVAVTVVVAAGRLGGVLSQETDEAGSPTPPPVHDPFADGHLETEEDCGKCDTHRYVGVALLSLALFLFAIGTIGVLRGFQKSAAVKDNGILNPMLRMSGVGSHSGDEESGGVYQTYTPGFHEDGSVRVESSSGCGRPNRYMTPELRAQVPSKPKAPDKTAAAANAMKVQGNGTYQEAMAMASGHPERSPLLLAAAETYLFALKKLGNVDDPKRDPEQVVPVWTACHLNLAGVYLETGDATKAEHHAGEVVNHETAFNLFRVASFKAHYRRGMARLSLGKTEEAAEDFICARAHSPGDRQLHAVCAATMSKLGREDFFGVYQVVAAAGAQVKETIDKSSKFVATLKKGEMVAVVDAQKNEVGQTRLHVLPWKTGDREVRGWTSLESESGVRILERKEIDFWKGEETPPQSWQSYLEEGKAKVSQGLAAAQVASSATQDLQEQAKLKASQALEAAREARNKYLTGQKQARYRSVRPGIIRQGVDGASEKVGNLETGEEVVALEEQGNRVKIDRGWVSKVSAKGTPLLTDITERKTLPVETVQEYARMLFVAITDLDSGFDHKDGQAGLGRRLYYDEFAAYLINAPASSEVLAQSTAGLSDLSLLKSVWDTVDKGCKHGVDVEGFGRVLQTMDESGDQDIWLAIQFVAVEVEFGGY